MSKKIKQIEFDFDPIVPEVSKTYADLNINQKINYRANSIITGYHNAFVGGTLYSVPAKIYCNTKFDILTKRWFEHHRINNPNNVDWYVPAYMSECIHEEKVKYILQQRELKRDLFNQKKLQHAS